jgi:hypothetical protein
MAGKSDYEREYRRYRQIRGDESRARDTAFKLIYLILLGNFEDETRDSARSSTRCCSSCLILALSSGGRGG